MASRSRVRSFFFTLLILALAGMTAYNAWQVRVLRSEVSTLEQEVAALKKGDRASASSPLDSLELVMKARKHADLAKKYIADGEFKKAKVELDESLMLMKRFSQTSGDSSKDAVDQLRKTWRDAGDSLERVWQGITEQSGGAKAKGG